MVIHYGHADGFAAAAADFSYEFLAARFSYVYGYFVRCPGES